MKRIAVFGVLVLAGCGSAMPKQTAQPAPTPDAVARAFVHAAAAGDYGATLEARFMPFAKGYKTLVSERVVGPFGVIGIRRGRQVEAIVMRKNGLVWKVDLLQPLKINPLGPQPGAREPVVQQVAVEVRGIHGHGVAVLYLDGVTLDSKSAFGPTSVTVYANLAAPLAKGSHSVVVFANAAAKAAAFAWSFSVR